MELSVPKSSLESVVMQFFDTKRTQFLSFFVTKRTQFLSFFVTKRMQIYSSYFKVFPENGLKFIVFLSYFFTE